jgi:hypothetical protein
MLSVLGRGVRLCDGISRREVLRVGGLGFTGLACADPFRGRRPGPRCRPPHRERLRQRSTSVRRPPVRPGCTPAASGRCSRG